MNIDTESNFFKECFKIFGYIAIACAIIWSMTDVTWAQNITYFYTVFIVIGAMLATAAGVLSSMLFKKFDEVVEDPELLEELLEDKDVKKSIKDYEEAMTKIKSTKHKIEKLVVYFAIVCLVMSGHILIGVIWTIAEIISQIVMLYFIQIFKKVEEAKESLL
ncbi:hypothetical protein KAR91_00630 [Candidatus Pacearchaeota archaeon]|nr:hypothetical protein [Candidatus Pacearchaeota archaeon]